MSIKTWEERYDPDGYIRGAARTKEVAMQAEIAELRAALAERDAEIAQMATPEQYHAIFAEVMESRSKLEAHRRVLEQSLEALNVMQEDVVSTPNAYEAQRQAVRAIQEVLHE